MSTILAGRFQLQDEVNFARQELISAGFPEDLISGFYVNQPGQHDMTPIGGDHITSPGAKESPGGVLAGEATGAAVGAAIGAVTAPLTGPAGPIVGGLVGAHVGSLYSFSHLKDKGEIEHNTTSEDERNNLQAPRPAGMLLAVEVHDPAEEDRALDVLRRTGAHHIERAEGHIDHGDWTDFNPLVPPQLVH
jgi:hypothetical protein